MGEATVTSRTPSEFEFKDVDATPALVVGAPFTGATLAAARATEDGLATTTDLGEAVRAQADGDGPVVVDEFAAAYRSATPDERAAFRDALVEGGEFLVSARPRAIDQLLAEDDDLASVVPGAFEAVSLLGYDPDDPDQRDLARRQCRVVAGEDWTLDESAVDSTFDQVRSPAYEFESAGLADLVGEYPQTLVPPVVAYAVAELGMGRAGDESRWVSALPDPDGLMVHEHVYTTAVWSFVRRHPWGPDEVARGVEHVYRAARVAATDATDHGTPPDRYLQNAYSTVVGDVAGLFPGSPGDAAPWLDDLDRRAVGAAGDLSEASPERFLQNFYSMAVARATWILEGNPSMVEEWVADLCRRAATTAADGSAHDESPHVFLSNVYAMAVARLAGSDPDDPGAVGSALDELAARTAETAVDGDLHDVTPAAFVENAWSMAVSKVTDSHPGDASGVEAWTRALADRATSAADVPADDHDPADPLARTLALSFAKAVGDDYPASVGPWPPAVWEAATETIGPDGLADLYRGSHRRVITGDPPFEWVVWLLRDARGRAMDEDPAAPDGREARAELLASVVVATVYPVAANAGYGSDHFRRVVDPVRSVAAADPEFFEAVLAAVADRFEADVPEYYLPVDWPADLAAERARFLAALAGAGLAGVADDERARAASDPTGRTAALTDLAAGFVGPDVGVDVRTTAARHALDALATEQGVTDAWTAAALSRVLDRGDRTAVVEAYTTYCDAATTLGDPEVIPFVVADAIVRTDPETGVESAVTGVEDRYAVRAGTTAVAVNALSGRSAFPGGPFEAVVSAVEADADRRDADLDPFVESVGDALGGERFGYNAAAATEWELAFA